MMSMTSVVLVIATASPFVEYAVPPCRQNASNDVQRQHSYDCPFVARSCSMICLLHLFHRTVRTEMRVSLSHEYTHHRLG